MAAPLAHFAINADDVDRARDFYSTVFGWTFEPWGPPGFLKIATGSDQPGHPIAALQQRRTLTDNEMTGFECTLAVDDVASTVVAATTAGGRVLMDVTRIDGVGLLAFLQDTEGNVVGAMQYDNP